MIHSPRKPQLHSVGRAVPARFGLVAAAVLALLAQSPTALAQQTQGAGSSASSDPSVQTITITTSARKRKEALQDVPMSLEAISGRDIQDAGITRVQDLQSSLPGLVVTGYESQGNIVLRGIGTGDVGLGTDQSVAIHLDGVYQAYGGAGLTRMFDIAVVEVLKGPQGTLYGRNSTAGVVNVTANAPGRAFAAQADLSYGSLKTAQAQGFVNVPVSDSTAVRLSFITSGSEGRITNTKDGSKVGALDDFWGLRLGSRSTFGDVLVDARVQYIEDKSDPFNANVPMPYAVGGAPATNNFDSAFFIVPPFQVKKDLNASLTITVPLGEASMKAITGYGRHRGDGLQVLDFGTTFDERQLLTINEPYDQISQELQFNFTTGKGTDWVAGVYALRFKGQDNRALVAGPNSSFAGFDFDARQKAGGRSMAAYVDVSHPLTSTLKLNGGLRYTWEKKDGTAFGLGPFDVNPAVSASKSWSAVTGRIGLDWAVTKNWRLWGNLSEGFKSGGVIPSGAFAGGGGVCDNGQFGSGCAITIYKPEELLALEVGSKWKLANDGGFVNVAAFAYDYRNKVEFYQFDPTNPLSFTFNNAQKARVTGLELSSDLRLARSVRMDLAASLLDGEYTRFVDGAGNDVATGKRLPRAPRSSATLGLSVQDIGLGGLGRGQLRVEYAWRDLIYFDILNNAPGNHTFERAIGLLNASFRLPLADSRWTLFASGRNLSNTRYIEWARDGVTAAVPATGRSWQVGAGYRF